jgi:hypothetical protein
MDWARADPAMTAMDIKERTLTILIFERRKEMSKECGLKMRDTGKRVTKGWI